MICPLCNDDYNEYCANCVKTLKHKSLRVGKDPKLAISLWEWGILNKLYGRGAKNDTNN